MLHVGLLIGIACGSIGVILLQIFLVCVYRVSRQVWPLKKQRLGNTTDVNNVSMHRVG